MIVFAVERNCVRSAITLGSVGGIRTAGLLACAAYITLVSSTGFPADVRAKNPPATLSAAERKQLATERDALVEKSKVLQAQGKLKEAIAATKDALAIERRVFGDLSDDVALSIERIGQFHLTLDEFTEARQAVEQARAILAKQHSKDHWRLTDARLILEDIQLHERLTPEQRKELAKADLVDAQALQLFQKGDFAQSIQSEARALEIRRRILGDGNLTSAESRFKLGTLYSWTGQYPKAETLFRESIDVSKKIKGISHPDTAASLNSLAGLYEAIDEFAKAEPLHLEAIKIFRETRGETHPHTAIALNDTAMLYASMGQYRKAATLYRESLKIHREVFGEMHRSTAICMNNLGELDHNMGNFAESEQLLRRAVAIQAKVLPEKHAARATTINNLASLYLSMGDTAKAESLLKQAIEGHRKGYGEFHPNTASSMELLGSLYESLHDYAKAEPLYQQALAIDRKTLGDKHQKTNEILIGVADLERRRGNFTKSETLYLEALGSQKKTLGEAHVATVQSLDGLGLVYEAIGKFDKSEPLFRQALEISTKVHGDKHPSNSVILNNFAFLYNVTGRSEKAEPLSRHALEISEEYFADGLRGQSERRQLALARTLRAHLDSYLTFTQQANVSETYRHVLGWKGAIFMGLLISRTMRHRPDLKPLFDELELASVRLSTLAMRGPRENLRATWERQMAELSDRKDELERNLAQKSDEFRRDKSLLQMEPAELQRSLPPDVALVDFLEYKQSRLPPSGKGLRIREPRMVAFVVRKDRPIQRFELGPVEPLAAAVAAWRKDIEQDTGVELVVNTPEGKFTGAPQQFLKDRVWTPLQRSLAGASMVLISPDGVLNQIPFAALPGDTPGSYLIEELTLVNVPVPRLLPFLLSKPKKAPSDKPFAADGSLLLVGNVRYGGSPGRSDGVMVAGRSAERGSQPGEFSFAELPGFATESAAIEESFKQEFHGGNLQLLSRDNATESAFRSAAPHNRFLHLATHGFFAPREMASALSSAPDDGVRGSSAFGSAGIKGSHPGLLSGVALSGANTRDSKGGDDGILTAVEVADLDLEQTELVVLSACETGRGETAGGEGVLGLQRAFQLAGARNVVASLWVIDDEATVALMRVFYHKLWNDKKPAAVALREAQLTLLRHPEEIKTLATRGPNFGKLMELPDGGKVPPKTTTASPRLWAAFVIAGPGID
jgi:CHAT domain-containing protein/tetratricopeptide (TPR) repeat protein